MGTHRRPGPPAYGPPARLIADPRTRRHLYTIAAAIVPLLVAYGVLTDSTASLWLGLAGAVLGTGAPILAAANTPPADDA